MKNQKMRPKSLPMNQFAILLVLFLITLAIPPLASASEVMTLTYRFQEPKIMQSGKYHSVIMDGLSNHGLPGKPVLPFKGVKILLPYNEEAAKVEILAAGKTTLRGTYQVAPGQEMMPLSFVGPVQPTEPDPKIYGSSAPYHDKPYGRWSVQGKDGFRFVMLNLYPVEYVPVRGLVSYYPELTVKVTTITSQSAGAGVQAQTASGREWRQPYTGRLTPQERKTIENMVDNPERMKSYPTAVAASLAAAFAGASVVGPGDYQYVIITSDALKNAAGPNMFQDLVAHKISRGVSATIVTTEWIYANYSGARPSGGEDNQTKIRNFISDANINWGTKYVLLGGDADGENLGKESGNVIVPVRNFYVDIGGYGDSIPADMYYSCLDGSFDSDADGIYGEPEDIVDGERADVDLFAEVYVGRAPVDSAEEVSNFVSKTIAFENILLGPDRKNALILGEWLGHQFGVEYGCDHKDEIVEGTCNYGYCTEGIEIDWNVSSLCDRNFLWKGKSDLVPLLNTGLPYLINHLGHADVGYSMKLYNSDVDGLTNSAPFVAYSQGCYSGSFDNRTSGGSHVDYDSIAEHFVTRPGGASAVIMNSRYGWGSPIDTDGPSQRFDREFFDAYFGESIFNLGMINQDSKEDNSGYIHDSRYGRWCAYSINLLGDPQTPLGSTAIRAGYIVFDQQVYSPGKNIGISLLDSDLNADPAVAERHVGLVTVQTASGDRETGITLTETGPDTSVFTGTLATSTAAALPDDGILQAGCADTITAVYHDADNGTGSPATSTDTAAMDCAPPAVSTIVAAPGYVDAVISWDTDEPADSRVLYGTSIPTDLTEWVALLVASHKVTLKNLVPGTTYYYAVESRDEAGNPTIDDNNGQYYTFTTRTPVTYIVPGDYPTIQAAIEAIPSFAGNEIVVRPGIYRENIVFRGKALLLRSEGGPELTVLDGGGVGSMVVFRDNEGPGSVLRGFTIQNGHAKGSGGGIYFFPGTSPTIINCIIRDNSAYLYGGGVYSSSSSLPTLINCTIANNTAGQSGGGIFSSFRAYTTARNCIVWGNKAGWNMEIDAYGGNTINITYSDVKGGWKGAGNLNCDPEFVGLGEYHLLPSSCCVDAGTNEGAPATDIDGDARPQGGGIDIGADEYRSHAGYMALDRDIYPHGAPVSIRIVDSDLNAGRNLADEYSDVITLTTAGGDQETGIIMSETGPDTNVFVGSIPTATTAVIPNDGVLQITCGIADTITATYLDADNGQGIPVTRMDTAGTDCFAPAVSNVAGSCTNFTATISWDTNEPADTKVLYGTTIPPQLNAGDPALVTSHSLRLTGLSSGATYFYAVESTDLAGNRTIDDNKGQYYRFATPTLGSHYVPDNYPTIQAAIDALSTSPENVVVVRPGVYRENIDFRGKGITVRSENGPETTIIDGGGVARVVNFSSNEGPASVLQGFTIKNGYAYGEGGGIYCYSASPTIDNCIVTSNDVQYPLVNFGAGITINSKGSNTAPKFTNCIITNNGGAEGLSSAVYSRFASPVFSNCVISGNRGKGIYSYNSQITIDNSSVDNNTSIGILIRSSSRATISNSAVSHNKTYGIMADAASGMTIDKSVVTNTSGVGISYFNTSSGMLSDSIVSSNTGFGIACSSSAVIMTNAVITDNLGGGISYTNTASAMVVNSTVGNNQGAGGGISCASSNPTVVNAILWGNTSGGRLKQISLDSASSIDVAYSDIQGGWAGVGNINADPLFVGGGDYHLTRTSPCIDAGTSDTAAFPHLPAGDIDGDSRLLSVAHDMGADEYFLDTDGDGVPTYRDCDVSNPDVYPGAPQICDGVNNDCNDPFWPSLPKDEKDKDRDGYSICKGDCNDKDAAVNPAAREVCGDGIDNDCNGLVDEAGCVAPYSSKAAADSTGEITDPPADLAAPSRGRARTPEGLVNRDKASMQGNTGGP